MKSNGFKCVKDQVRSYTNFLKVNTPLIWSILKKLKDQLLILLRLKDVFMMMILFHVWPEQTYRFSTRKLLPSKKNRLSKESKPIIPYELLKSKSSNIPMMKEINIISKGTSFNLNDIKKINGPIFLITFWSPLRMDNNGNLLGGKYTPAYESRILGKKKNINDVPHDSPTTCW